MRLNRYVAAATGRSRRAADELIAAGQVTINDKLASIGQSVTDDDIVCMDGQRIQPLAARAVIFNKPAGYVTSRRQQGQWPTIYELLPADMGYLKPVGRLDAESSGLLVLTNDGDLALRLAHPSNGKLKRYVVELDQKLRAADQAKLRRGVELKDGLSQLEVEPRGKVLLVSLGEGRNRQIRRSFGALGYRVERLHRVEMGDLALDDLAAGKWRELPL